MTGGGNPPVVTRFAPSPTGTMHIGGARTCLFNWLFARHHGGRFLLRIEDTDRVRSTKEAIAAIIDGLTWLGLAPDEPPSFQSQRAARHGEAAHRLLEAGLAYRCYCSPERLKAMRERLHAEGKKVRYDGSCRDRDPSPGDGPCAIRLRAPQSGETTIADQVQGKVTVANAEMDDLILLRSDGSPTYLLSVVVDDHDSAITHVIRGDDHLTNAFRQTQIYLALGWVPPIFAHIPLIHGADGAKLSKRHGAFGLDELRDQGILPAALRNYLLRLGWSHGDDEMIGQDQAIAWFDLDGVGRAPARFDPDKLLYLNGWYIREHLSNEEALALIASRLGKDSATRAGPLVSALRERSHTLTELVDGARFLVERGRLDDKAAAMIKRADKNLLKQIFGAVEGIESWEPASIEAVLRDFAKEREIGLGGIAQPLRALLTGSLASPGIFDVMAALGKEETLNRLRD